jgi:glycosyl hydrolase family 26
MRLGRARTAIAAGLTAVCLAAIGHGTAAAGPASGQALIPPPDGGIYHAAFPEFGGAEDKVSAARITGFESLVGKPIAWAYFSNNWFGGIQFPQANVDQVRAAGRIPFIRLMAWSRFRDRGADTTYTLDRIIAGQFDAQLAAWGQAAGTQPFPMLVEFGTEVNGQWFPWNGKWAGGGATTGYGDPSLPDGPERFRDAYRHVHDVITAAGADNLTWFWHVVPDGQPAAAWNSIANYYPGDAYVDWSGVSVYGPIGYGEKWRPFSRGMDRAYAALTAVAPSKPIAVLEYSAIQDRRKAGWLRAAINAVASGRWPQVKALSVFHSRFRGPNGVVNLHVNSDKRSLRAYRGAIANPVFVSTPVFGTR